MQPTDATVLLIEDDQSLRESLAMVLEHQGYDVLQAATGEVGLSLAEAESPQVVVLDINLPGMDGFDVCSLLRKRHYSGPVLMLTALHQVENRVAGLDVGADDYLAKPFSLQELLARVRAMMRRVNADLQGRQSNDQLRVADLVIYPASRRVEQAGTEVELTRTEFDLLHLLASNVDIVMTRDVIHEQVWGYEADFGSNSLQVFVSTLRRKVEFSGSARLIHTVRGVGYVIREPR